MHVSENVEWTMLRLAVVPERLSFDGCRIDFSRRRELEDVPNTFTLEAA
jgi:hypothetical protein